MYKKIEENELKRLNDFLSENKGNQFIVIENHLYSESTTSEIRYLSFDIDCILEVVQNIYENYFDEEDLLLILNNEKDTDFSNSIRVSIIESDRLIYITSVTTT